MSASALFGQYQFPQVIEQFHEGLEQLSAKPLGKLNKLARSFDQIRQRIRFASNDFKHRSIAYADNMINYEFPKLIAENVNAVVTHTSGFTSTFVNHLDTDALAQATNRVLKENPHLLASFTKSIDSEITAMMLNNLMSEHPELLNQVAEHIDTEILATSMTVFLNNNGDFVGKLILNLGGKTVAGSIQEAVITDKVFLLEFFDEMILKPINNAIERGVFRELVVEIVLKSPQKFVLPKLSKQIS